MCPPRRPKAPPAPAPIPQAPPVIETPEIVESKATTKRTAPRVATSTSSTSTAPKKTDESVVKKKKGRSTLRIPLLTTPNTGSGVNFPSP
jgi:hypothetical protein